MNDHPTITLPAARLGAAWQTTWAAHQPNKDHPAHRTITIEWHERGLRLIATNGHTLLRTWIGVSDLAAEPGPDEAPEHTTVVADTDRRALQLIKYATARDEKDDDLVYELTLEVAVSSRSLLTPALAEDLEPLVLRVRHDGETVELPVVHHNPPDWRSLHTNPDPLDTIAIGHQVLDVLAKTGLDFHATFTGTHSGVRLQAVGPLPYACQGLAMPMRLPEAHSADEAA